MLCLDLDMGLSRLGSPPTAMDAFAWLWPTSHAGFPVWFQDGGQPLKAFVTLFALDEVFAFLTQQTYVVICLSLSRHNGH